MYKILHIQFQNLLSFTNKYRTHLLLWALFILYETFLASVIFDVSIKPIVYGGHYLVIILFFYLHANMVLPWTLNKKPKLVFLYLPIIVLIQIAAYILSHFMMGKLLGYLRLIDTSESKEISISYILKNLYRGVYFMGFATGYYYLKTYLKEKKRTAILEKEKLEEKIRVQQIEKELISAQNAFLQAQINPHFLFNTLDFVYHEVNTQSPKAGATIMSLATMMRYALDAGQTGHEVFLHDEIAQVKELIFINQIRKHNELNLSLKVEPEVQGLRMIPLVLLTLVENMFKHGDLQDKVHPASIYLFVKEGVFYIQTTNLCNAASAQMSSQQGLKNIQQRLHTNYSDKAKFTYETSPEQLFHTRLSISVELMR
jgi:two-component system LytT family sensor kinase